MGRVSPWLQQTRAPATGRPQSPKRQPKSRFRPNKAVPRYISALRPNLSQHFERARIAKGTRTAPSQRQKNKHKKHSLATFIERLQNATSRHRCSTSIPRDACMYVYTVHRRQRQPAGTRQKTGRRATHNESSISGAFHMPADGPVHILRRPIRAGSLEIASTGARLARPTTF